MRRMEVQSKQSPFSDIVKNQISLTSAGFKDSFFYLKCNVVHLVSAQGQVTYQSLEAAKLFNLTSQYRLNAENILLFS